MDVNSMFSRREVMQVEHDLHAHVSGLDGSGAYAFALRIF
jgi:hypothetical protein